MKDLFSETRPRIEGRISFITSTLRDFDRSLCFTPPNAATPLSCFFIYLAAISMSSKVNS